MNNEPPKYLIMDARAFDDIDSAVVLDTADTKKQAINRGYKFGRLRMKEVAIVNRLTNKIAWECY
jgi:hypothetical protein